MITRGFASILILILALITLTAFPARSVPIAARHAVYSGARVLSKSSPVPVAVVDYKDVACVTILQAVSVSPSRPSRRTRTEAAGYCKPIPIGVAVPLTQPPRSSNNIRLS